MSIRQLRHGDPIPIGEPSRLRNGAGYMRLRWKVGPGEFVECFEHRYVMGLPPRDVEVHHKNHVRDDNRPENLMVVTPAEHGREHRTLDDESIVGDYATGLSTVAVAERHGIDAGTVWRVLQRNGIAIRPGAGYNRKHVDRERIRQLYADGMGTRTIGRQLSVSQYLVIARLRELGVELRRPGRPRK